MMKRGRSKGNTPKRHRFICHRCGATPPWSKAQHHRDTCTAAQKTYRHREDRT